MSTEAEEPPTRGAVSARLLQGGREPDPRFSLANERTFLAWIRTSLAFLAGGIALEAFATDLFQPQVRHGLALVLVLVGLLLSLNATFRWLQVERAMRHGRALPLPWVAPVVALGAAIASGVFIASLLLT